MRCVPCVITKRPRVLVSSSSTAFAAVWTGVALAGMGRGFATAGVTAGLVEAFLLLAWTFFTRTGEPFLSALGTAETRPGLISMPDSAARATISLGVRSEWSRINA